MTGILTFPTVVSPELARIADLRTRSLKMDALPDTLNVLQWIQLFDPYVKTTVENGAKVFSLDERGTGLPEDDDYLTTARICCAVANALPASQRPSESWAVSKQPYNGAANAECVPHGNYRPTGDIPTAMTIARSQNTAEAGDRQRSLRRAGWRCTGCRGWGKAAWWQVDSAWMAQADSHCNNAGADLSASWATPGVFWVKPMC
jgi:hypothetical protein